MCTVMRQLSCDNEKIRKSNNNNSWPLRASVCFGTWLYCYDIISKQK